MGVVQRFLTGGDFAPLESFDNVWIHFWFSQLVGKSVATDTYLVEARDSAKHPKTYRAAPHNKEILGPKCQVLKLRSPCVVIMHCGFNLHILDNYQY